MRESVPSVQAGAKGANTMLPVMFATDTRAGTM